jgi:GH15 family glucan-1,4-alpha-glucosidase
VFAHLLGGPEAGHFSVGPHRSALPLSQRYIDSTMTVQTRWASLSVTDYLPHDVRQGRTDLTRVISGQAAAVVTFAPRPEFGQGQVILEAVSEGLRVHGTNEPIVLRSPGVQWNVTSDGNQQTAHAVVDPSGGDVVLELRCGTEELGPSETPEEERRALAESYWSDWAKSLTLPTLKPDLMKRSALTLRGLVHVDSGAIMAAATTSLPEEIGGVRNWDYRYCWLRDAALTASALVSLGSLSEAEGYLDWVHDVLETLPGPERLHPLYTLHGGGLPPEAVIDSLPGYAGSRPVRIGNAANQQVQLDVFGPIVELIHDLSHAREKQGVEVALNDRDWELVCAMVEAVERRWFEPDHGIWEIRDNPRHHVYSKVMAWVAFDRAVRSVEEQGLRGPVDRWREQRDRIHAQVCERGFDAELDSFTQSYDSKELDASLLLIPLVGFLPAGDPRVRATVAAIERELLRDGLVLRYRVHEESADGLPGDEGVFLPCSFWLCDCYELLGRHDEAHALFERLVGLANDVGLLAEGYDPHAERQRGNIPQAFTHHALVNTAFTVLPHLPAPAHPRHERARRRSQR